MVAVQESERSYKALDGVRGMAALCIVSHHAHRLFEGYSLPIALPIAHLAVDLFFVLSGFVLAHAYGSKLANGLAPSRFMALRLVRLFPLYALGTALGLLQTTLATIYHQGSVDWSWEALVKSFPFSMAMLPSPYGPSLFPFNTPMWSIFFEVLVNIGWAVFWRPLSSTRLLTIVLVASGAAMAATSLHLSDTNLGLEWPTFLGGAARVTFGFLAGVLIYRMHKRVAVPCVPTLALLAAPPLLFSIPMPVPMQLIMAMMVLPTLVLLGSKSQPSGRMAQVCHVLGIASYPIYALHQPLYYLSYALMLRLGWDARSAAPWVGLLFAACLILVGSILHSGYDQPARSWLGRIIPQRKRLAPVES